MGTSTSNQNSKEIKAHLEANTKQAKQLKVKEETEQIQVVTLWTQLFLNI